MFAQGLALATAVGLLAFPVRAFLIAPEAPLTAKLLWTLLFAIGALPAWRARLLIVGTPFLPWLPFAVEGLPNGVVHLLVLSQGIPWLFQRGFTRRAPATDTIGRLWLLFLLTSLCAAIPYYAAFALRFDGATPFLADVSEQLHRYVFLGPSIEFANILVACSAFGDAVLAWLIVRSAPDSTRRLLQIAGCTAAGVAAAGLWQAWSGAGLRVDWRVNDPFLTRINGTFNDPNALAAFLGVMAPILAALSGRASGRERVAWGAGLAVVMTALVLTAGRVGLLGGLAGIAAVALGALRHGLDRQDSWPIVRRHGRRAVAAAFVVGVATVALLVLAGTTLDARHHLQQSYVDTWLYTFNLRRPLDETAKGRLGIWRTAGHIVRDQPFFGVGPGRIFRVFPGYSQDVPEAPQGIALSAHDTFLQITAELGLVGLVAWLALLVAILHAAWRGASPRTESEPDGGAWLGIGLLGAWCATLVVMTTGDRTILREDLVTLGILSALVARRLPAGAPSRVAGRLVLVAALALVAITPLRVRAAGAEVRLDRVTAGLHGLERARDGTTFRWTSGRAVFHLPPATSVMTLTVRAIAPFRQTVRVFVRNAQVAELTPEDAGWRSTRIVLPQTRSPEYHRIEIQVSPTWRPPGDGRELGVMLAWPER